MKKIPQLLIFYFILSISLAIQLEIDEPQTCFDYVVQRKQSKKMFYFHYSHSDGNINLVIYRKNIKSKWYETGFGIDYNTTLQINYQQAGNYTLCFKKQTEGSVNVSFQIIDEDDLSEFVGKEQLAKLSGRISQSLTNIKEVGFRFKQVLQHHNRRKQFILLQQNQYSYLLVLKTAVMIAVVVVQVLIVKKIFK